MQSHPAISQPTTLKRCVRTNHATAIFSLAFPPHVGVSHRISPALRFSWLRPPPTTCMAPFFPSMAVGSHVDVGPTDFPAASYDFSLIPRSRASQHTFAEDLWASLLCARAQPVLCHSSKLATHAHVRRRAIQPSV